MTNPTETERTLIQLHFSSAQLAAPSYARLPLGCPLLGAQPGILRRPTEGFPISYVIYFSQGSRDISIPIPAVRASSRPRTASGLHQFMPVSPVLLDRSRCFPSNSSSNQEQHRIPRSTNWFSLAEGSRLVSLGLALELHVSSNYCCPSIAPPQNCFAS